MDKHVFVSYKHEDGDFAENLIHRVEKKGFRVWVDSDKLDAGNDWRAGIDQAIKDAFALIVIMTPEAKASEYVTYEWSFAWGAGIKVIPVLLKSTPLHPRLESLQYLDFTSHTNRPWDKLTAAIENASSLHSSAETSQPQNISISKIIEAASFLVAAVAETQGTTSKSVTEQTKEIAESINRLVTTKAPKQIYGTSILWVDDSPPNNKYEMQALEALGIQFTISTSTEDALEKVYLKNYDLIISDMGRPRDIRAGYTLLDELRKRHITTPFIIYSGSKRPEHVAEAVRRGAVGATNNSQELVELVVDTIRNG